MLRNYQQDAIDRLRSAEDHSLLVMPTGTGKTYTICVYIKGTRQKAVILAHREELIQQFESTLSQLKMAYGIFTSLRKENLDARTIISTPLMIEKLMPTTRGTLVIDEAHLTKGATYSRIISRHVGKVIGLTATPQRTDKQELDLPNWIVPISFATAIDQGYLCDVKMYSPEGYLTTDGVKLSVGDYNASQLEQQTDDEFLHKVLHLMSKHDKHIVYFAPNVNTAKKIASFLNKNGRVAEAVLGDTVNRKDGLDNFRAGMIEVLVNVQVMVEGIDIPEIKTIFFGTATTSVIKWIQALGRGMRPSKNKTHCVVYDLGGSVFRFGLPKHYIPESTKKSYHTPPQMKACKACGHVEYVSAKMCSACGAEFSVKVKSKAGIAEFSYKEIDETKALITRLSNMYSSQVPVCYLRAYAALRQYKPSWISYQLKNRGLLRFGSKPSPKDIATANIICKREEDASGASDFLLLTKKYFGV